MLIKIWFYWYKLHYLYKKNQIKFLLKNINKYGYNEISWIENKTKKYHKKEEYYSKLFS